MDKVIMSPNSFGKVWTSGGGGIQFAVSGSHNENERWGKLVQKFESDATSMLREQGSALCHEMARYSLPTRANTTLTANNALSIYESENKALAGIAFKPWDSRSAMFWLLSPYSDVADYVVKSSGFKFTSRNAQNLYNIQKFDLLRDFLKSKGFVPSKDIPDPSFVSEKAELGKFINWKSQYKKTSGKARGPYYVKDKASIQKIANEKSLYNYASIVINGWLAASKDLGNKLPSGVKFISWPYGKGLGSGRASVKRENETSISMTIINDYYNLNGIFNSSIQQTIWKNRNALIESEINKFFDKMVKYYNSIK